MAVYRGTTQIVAAVKGALSRTPQFKFINRKMQADRLQRYRRESLAEGPRVSGAATVDSLVRDRIELYSRTGTVKNYAEIRSEVIDDMTGGRPSEVAITAWADQWRRLHGAAPSAGHYAGIRSDIANLMVKGFTPEQVRNSGLGLHAAAELARQGRKLPQDPNLVDGATSYPKQRPTPDSPMQSRSAYQYSREGRQSPAMVARVRERIEHYSKVGVHKEYHEIVAEVSASMR